MCSDCIFACICMCCVCIRLCHLCWCCILCAFLLVAYHPYFCEWISIRCSVCRNGKLTSTASSLRGPDALPQKLYLMLPSVSHDHDKPVSLADTTVHRAMSSIAGERLATYCPAVPYANPAGFVLFFLCKAPW